VTRLSPLAVVSAAVGLVLFGLMIRQAGVEPILTGIQRLGIFGFLVVVACGVMRMMLRALAWTLCASHGVRLPFGDALRAVMAGDAIGNVTPLGLLASEPIKAAMVRHRVSLMDALASITIENLFYTASVVIMIAVGLALLLLDFDVSGVLRTMSLAALGALAAGTLALLAVLGRGWKPVSASVGWLERRRRGPSGLRSRLEKLRTLEDQVYSFHERHPRRTPLVVTAEVGFHVLAVVEMWVTLALLTGSVPSLLAVFILEAVNRAIIVAFKFVPLRLGVDEAGSELLVRTLTLPAGLGVTMAIIRKARVLTLSSVGLWWFSTRAGTSR
jgi:uncharacterized membrane protein YbhN (UPF0104 family)